MHRIDKKTEILLTISAWPMFFTALSLCGRRRRGGKKNEKNLQTWPRKKRRDSNWISLTARHSTVKWVLHISLGGKMKNSIGVFGVALVCLCRLFCLPVLWCWHGLRLTTLKAGWIFKTYKNSHRSWRVHWRLRLSATSRHQLKKHWTLLMKTL